MVVCLCKGVSDKKIRWLVQNGATNLKEVTSICKAGRDCGACITDVRSIVRTTRAQLKLSQTDPALEQTLDAAEGFGDSTGC